MTTHDLLCVENIDTFYGRSQVLFSMALTIRAGEVITLLGRNGMGKTTTIRSIMGLTPAATGSIRFCGRELRGLQAYRIAKLGIGLVPEGRQIFPNLSVHENLIATANKPRAEGAGWDYERVVRLFPRLAERAASMGNQLSGGEQQMLAVGRALMTNPQLLILDEATEGLAPLIRQEIWNCLNALKQAGLAILIVDKNIDALTRLADRHYVIEKGRVVWQGRSDDLAGDATIRHRYLGV